MHHARDKKEILFPELLFRTRSEHYKTDMAMEHHNILQCLIHQIVKDLDPKICLAVIGQRLICASTDIANLKVGTSLLIGCY